MTYSWIYLINKPIWITSFGVIARMRRILWIKKIWHAWTLDPFAHGLMIVAVGRDYTRMIDQYVGMDKTYTAVIKLWEVSETMDSEWPIEFCSDQIPTQEQVEQGVVSQIQTYDQLPPNFSAKKIGGVPAYKLARAGKDVELKTKEVTIHHAELIEYCYPFVTVKYRVSSGTYIRVLAHELGQNLGTGAYCEQLCRDSIGEWDLQDGVNLDDLMSDVRPPSQGGIKGGFEETKEPKEWLITNWYCLPYHPDNVSKAKVLRAEMTQAEKALWYNCLRELQIFRIPSLSSDLESPLHPPLQKGGVNFQGEHQLHRLKVLRQQPIDNYIVDFYIVSVCLVIEIDGDSHYMNESIRYDQQRTQDLGQYGLHVMRFTNTEVYENFEGVCEQIIHYCQAHYQPSQIVQPSWEQLLLNSKISTNELDV